MRGFAAFLGTVVVFSAGVSGCRQTDAPGEEQAALEGALQSLVDSIARAEGAIPGVALHVEAPHLRLAWSGAAGVTDRKSGTPLTPQHPVRVASNTKTFVAAAILRLWEEGQLELDAPITEHLPAEFLQVMRLDGYEPDDITIRHLLTHTSGLFDYADSETYSLKINADPTHRWSRAEQVQSAMDWGEPYGAPGEVYRYSDTGYILLGEIIAHTTGQSLAVALRDLMDYERLGLTSTWLETLEPKPPGTADRAHQYLGDIDSYAWDPSFDLYGGGGLVATVGDLARFIRGIFTGGVYARPGTSDTMLTTIAAARGGPAAWGATQVPGTYRMGVAVNEIEGVTVYMHTGYWGTLAAYVPSLDLALGATVTQQESNALGVLFRRALGLVRAAAETEQAPTK